MAEFPRWFALAALLLVLFGGCVGNNAQKEPATTTIEPTTTEKTITSTSIASATSTAQKKATTSSTTLTTTTTTTTLPEPNRPNPQAVLLSNLTNTGFAASYQGYLFSIGHLIYGYDNSIAGALLHVSRPNSTYIDVSVMKDSSDSMLDNKIIIRFVPEYAKEAAGIQTGAIYVWPNENYTVQVPNESATTSTGWITINSPSNITYMEDGAFAASFMNNAGMQIKITGILLNETDADAKCKNILANGRQAELAYPVTVDNGESFAITADCPLKDYDTGYYLEFSISYNTVIDNEVFKHKATGYMTGRVKPYDEHYTP